MGLKLIGLFVLILVVVAGLLWLIENVSFKK